MKSFKAKGDSDDDRVMNYDYVTGWADAASDDDDRRARNPESVVDNASWDLKEISSDASSVEDPNSRGAAAEAMRILSQRKLGHN